MLKYKCEKPQIGGTGVCFRFKGLLKSPPFSKGAIFHKSLQGKTLPMHITPKILKKSVFGCP